MNDEGLLKKRRAGFEEWAACEGMNVSFSFVRNIYDNRETRIAWRAWNASLDSVEIELPSSLEIDDEWDSCTVGFNQGIEECRELIQQQGYKVEQE